MHLKESLISLPMNTHNFWYVKGQEVWWDDR